MIRSETTNSQKRARWLTPLAVALVVLAVWGWSGFGEVENRQTRNMIALGVTLVGVLYWVVWVIVFSPFSRLFRRLFGAVAVILAATAALTLEIRGVSGDLIPIVTWRWSPKVEALPQHDGAAPIAPQSAVSTDWAYPQFLGPNRNGIVTGIQLARDWEQTPPRQVWRRPIGEGWSGFAVMGEFAVTQEQRGDRELVVCYELSSGRILWSHADAARMADVVSGNGPRATPTIVSGRVFTNGATGTLNCLDLASGELIWTRNFLADHGASKPQYGVSHSPLVVDGMVVVVAGGRAGNSLVAYDQRDGSPLWSGGNDPAGYSSPLLTEIAGLRQILVFNNVNLVGHDAENGRVLWQFPWPSGSEHASQPVILDGDRVFLSSGYGVGCKLLQIEKTAADSMSASLIWETPRLKAKFTNVVLKDGYMYGLDDGVLVCLDLTNGDRKWKAGRYGHGQILLAGNLLLVQTERGAVVLIDPRPEAHTELGSFQAIEGKSWNHPALAGPYLLVRNAKEAACFQLPLAAPSG